MSAPAFVYLHGFASSPRSKKAQVFVGHLAEHGIRAEVPDLNESAPGRGDFAFEQLTVTRMLVAARRAAGPGEAVLIGSSLGGYVSALLAARDPRVQAVVAMAPAFDFPRRISSRFPGAKPGDRAETFHHGTGKNEWISYGLVEDGLRYEGFPDVRCPMLIVHGERDESVPVELSRAFAQSRENVKLIVVDDDHQLLASAERIWNEARDFLRLR